MSVKLVDIVFDGPPSHKSGRFVEMAISGTHPSCFDKVYAYGD